MTPTQVWLLTLASGEKLVCSTVSCADLSLALSYHKFGKIEKVHNPNNDSYIFTVNDLPVALAEKLTYYEKPDHL
jgi:hypothetical protein